MRHRGLGKGGFGPVPGSSWPLQARLEDLDKRDTVAVAHWCDNGDSKLDLLPTANVEEALRSLEQVLAPNLEAHPTGRLGELGLQRALHFIINATLASEPEPLPVVLFLYGDHSGMDRPEADHLIDELLANLGSSLWAEGPPISGHSLRARRTEEIADYIAAQTAGQYLTSR